MSEIEKIILTSVFTIFGGVLIYVLGQLISKIFIEPINELKKTIGEVRYNLAFHATIIITPLSRTPELSQKTQEALMKNSCDLLTCVDSILYYERLSRFFCKFLPPKSSIIDSANNLRTLSTYVTEQDVGRASNSLDTINKIIALIEKNLGLKPLF